MPELPDNFFVEKIELYPPEDGKLGYFLNFFGRDNEGKEFCHAVGPILRMTPHSIVGFLKENA